ncbi:MAG: PilC/PilY family type IV pilus protein [Burkholderiaceae bacterium]
MPALKSIRNRLGHNVPMLVLILTCAQALAVPAQLPLLSAGGGTARPNVMFMVDDSESMGRYYLPESAWDKMPSDAIAEVPKWIAFDPDEAADASVSGLALSLKQRFVATTHDAFTARFRSAQFNRLYYDPDTRYLPWFNPDGSMAPPAFAKRAPLHPHLPSLGTVDLTFNRPVSANWCTQDICKSRKLLYSPAVYFVHKGGSFFDAGNYTRVDISQHGSFDRPATRTDCSPGAGGRRICSKGQEMTNFANWFVYHRKRHFAMVAAVTRAFARQGDGIRLGFGSVNGASLVIDNHPESGIAMGVRKYADPYRIPFIVWLRTSVFQHARNRKGLRKAIDAVGRYFSRSDRLGPWTDNPGAVNSTPDLACRKAYAILATDGDWDGESAMDPVARRNVDGLDGPLITGPSGLSYQYKPAHPYTDSDDNNLADVAMHYWNRDLRPDLENIVGPDDANPAFWQNLVLFSVGLGVEGTLEPASDLPRLTSGSLNWPTIPDIGGVRVGVDDLWHASINARGQHYRASHPDRLAEAFESILKEIANRQSTATSALAGGQLSQGGTAINAIKLDSDSLKYVPGYKPGKWSGEVVAKRLDANGQPMGEAWRASRKLPMPDKRNLWLGRGGNSAPVPFRWESLDANQKAQLGPLASQELVDFLRGDRGHEGSIFRSRDPGSVLGDFVNSSPLLVGEMLNEQYQFLPEGTPGRDTYRQFLNNKRTRPQVLFVGGNDGMVHGFNGRTGVEVFGFIPRSLLHSIPELARPDYEHRFFVDGPLVEADAYLGSWRNLVLGTLGAGGTSVFALDVTQTASLGSGTVLWEFDHPNMGHNFSAPAVGVTTGGRWVAVFGNGVDSKGGAGAADKARLFVVDLKTGALLKQITLPGKDNGLGGVRLVRNVQNQVVAAYAGDLLGNLWRFDMNAPAPSGWDVGMGGQPLFQASSKGQIKPVLGTPEYLVHPLGGQMVLFGTGQLYTEAHLSDTSLQSLFGIWDQMPGQYPSKSLDRVTASDPIVQQTFSGTGGSGSTVHYTGTSHGIDWTKDRGWQLDLTIMSGQRMLHQPQIARGHALFSTVVPTSDATSESCEGGGATGINVLINALTGAQAAHPVLDSNRDGRVTDADAPAIAYKTQADGIGRLMYGSQGRVVIQQASSETNASLMGRPVERRWRQIVTRKRE